MHGRMLWENRYFDAATLTAASAASGYPVTALQDRLRSRAWRSTSISSQYIDIDFGEARPFNAIALVDHNLTFTGTITVTAGNTPGGSEIVNLTADAWLPVIGFGEGPAGYSPIIGFFEEADRQYMIPRPVRVIYLEDFDYEAVDARYIRIAFTDGDNTDGYLQCARLLVGIYGDFGKNFHSIQHEWVDDSEPRMTVGGQCWVNRVPLRLALTLNFNHLIYTDKFWFMLRAAYQMGVRESFVIDCFPDPDNPSERHFATVYGRFQKLPAFSQSVDAPFYESQHTTQMDFVVEEVL